jgi:hypothetical protein
MPKVSSIAASCQAGRTELKPGEMPTRDSETLVPRMTNTVSVLLLAMLRTKVMSRDNRVASCTSARGINRLAIVGSRRRSTDLCL